MLHSEPAVGRKEAIDTTNVRTIVLLGIAWTAALAVAVMGLSARGVSHSKRATDFVHFYTLGHLASSHEVSTLYDAAALREAHIALVPTSAAHVFPPVYPPQVAVLFAPLSALSYEHALLLWNALTVVLYGLIVWTAWRPVSHLLPNRLLVFTAAAAFPPVWSLLLTGQNTIVILAALWAGWLALERKRPLLAGMAFGLLAVKPQFGIALAVVVLAAGEWAMLAGALLSAAAQALAVWLTLGWPAFEGFARTIPNTFGHFDGLESKPFMNHSLRSLTELAPGWIAVPLWVGLVGVVLWYTARIWRSEASVRVRLGALILATGLVNPHFQIYDVTVLALPLLWLGAFMQERGKRSDWYWKGVFWLFAVLFVQSMVNVPLYLSVVLMAGFFALIVREVVYDDGESVSYTRRAA